jgi:hypothetical protein
VTVVTNARAYYQYTRGCGRIGRPAFPAPSDVRAGQFRQNSREMRGEIAESYPCRHCEERSDEAIHTFFLVASWIASLALAMTVANPVAFWLFENLNLSCVVPAQCHAAHARQS